MQNEIILKIILTAVGLLTTAALTRRASSTIRATVTYRI